MAAVIGAFSLGSCSPIVPTLVVNLTDADLAVHYYAPPREDSAGAGMGCPLREAPPRWRRGVKGTHAAAEWQVMTSARLDYANCTADLVIPPRSTAWILINATCEDSEKLLARNPAVRPTIQSLSATQGGRRMSLEGWDVARAFRHRSGFCTLKIDTDDLK